MSLLDKFDAMTAVRAELTARGLRPFGAINEKIISPTEGTIAGKRVILAGTHNYLGLTFEPECIEAAQRCVAEQGTGTCGSRMAAGTYAEHDALESELAAFFGRRYGIVFSTGFSACMGVPATLAGPGDTILMDSDSHASIYDGVRLSGAEVVRFRHNDAANLEKRLERLGDKAKDTLVVVEGIYSMLGDMAPLGAIAELKRKYGFCLLVDEAHGIGVRGTGGRGLLHEAGLSGATDVVITTTLSKSLGSQGGAVLGPAAVRDHLIDTARPFIFDTGLAPAAVGAAMAALRVLADEPWRPQAVLDHARALADVCRVAEIPQSAVVSVIIGDPDAAVAAAATCLQAGLLVGCFRPPSVPAGTSRLRLTARATLTEADLDVARRVLGSLPARGG